MTDATNLIRIIQEVQPDEIYNLAAQSHVMVSFETPEYTANADSLGTLRLLEAIRILGLEKSCKFYQASTSELFGKAEESPQGEVKKTELELLEERDENELTEEEEDRMYELRRLRAQKNMNNEVREAEQAELKKADEEIAHLKTLLKPKPKKLPKGYIA